MYEANVGIIRASEDNLIQRIDWERLVDMVTVRDVWNELERLNAGYKNIKDYDNINNISKEFMNNVISLYEKISSLFIEEDLKISLLLEFDIHNLKLKFKEKTLNIDLKQNYINSGWFGIKDFEDYPEEFKETIKLLSRNKPTTTQKDFDILLDNLLFGFRIKTAKNLKNDFLLNYWKKIIDLNNLRIFSTTENKKELRKYFIDGGNIPIEYWQNWIELSQNDILEKIEFWGYQDIFDKMIKDINSVKWEQAEEEYMLEYINDAIMYSQSAEPVIAYFYRRLCELKNINRILYGKAYKLKNEDIHRQLSKTYLS